MLKRTLRKLVRRNTRSDSAAQIVEFNGARIVCTPFNKLENKLLKDAAGYDLPNFRALTALVREDDICFDIGANIGIYSSVLSRCVGANGHVHAFEPVRHIRRKLNTNLAMNGARNVTVNGFALGAEPGELPMFQVKEGIFRAGTSTFMRNNNVEAMGEDSFEKEIVRITTLDAYAEEKTLPHLGFIKIDVEGFELNVFKGAFKTLAKFKPAILFEHDQKRLGGIQVDEKEFADILGGLEYSCFEISMMGERLSLEPFNFDRKIHGNNLIALHIPA